MREHEKWVWFAKQDLKAAEKLISDDEVILNPALYHCQQCIEKILKAYLVFKQQSITKTHDLVKLLEYCVKFDKTFEQLLEISSDLNPYVSQARYPDTVIFLPDLTTFKIILSQTKEAFFFVEQKIKEN